MSEKCSKCFDSTINLNNVLKCSVCAKLYHNVCVGIRDDSFAKLSNNTKARWSCQNCLDSTKKPKINTEKSNNTLEELVRSVNFMSTQFDEFIKVQNDILEEIKNLKRENIKLKEENDLLNKEVKQLITKVDSFEQQLLESSIEISGIPVTKNENCIDIINKLSEKLGEQITVDHAFRLNIPKRNINKIVAKLKDIKMKKNIIKSWKSNRSLCASDIYSGFNKDDKIYINECLTKSRRQLFGKARSAAKLNGFKYVWVNDGDILARKEDGTKILKIRNEDDLTKLQIN